MLILGTGVPAQKVAREMLKRAPIGYRVLGFLTEHEGEVGRTLVNPSVLGTLADLPRLSESLDATLIVVAQEDRRKRLPVDLLLRCRMAGVRVVEAANLFEGLSGRIPLRDLRPSWLIFSGGFHKPRVLASVKRVGEAVTRRGAADRSRRRSLRSRRSSCGCRARGRCSTARRASGSTARPSSC